MSTKDRWQIGASVDLLGALWTDPKQFTRVIPVEEFPGVRHAELVGVGSVRRIARLRRGLKEAGIRAVQLHGPTGNSDTAPISDRLKVWAMSPFLVSPADAALLFADMELVVHAPAVRALRKRRRAEDLRGLHVLVENHDSGMAGIGAALDEARALRDLGIRADVLVDIGHVTRWPETRKEFDSRWKHMVRDIGDLTADRTGPVWELHAPEGTMVNDSLPGHMTLSHRRDLIQAIGPSVRRFFFEYQRSGMLGLLHLFGKNERYHRRRISAVFTNWGNAGLFERA